MRRSSTVVLHEHCMELVCKGSLSEGLLLLLLTNYIQVLDFMNKLFQVRSKYLLALAPCLGSKRLNPDKL
jgi:hypothetical protein